MDWLELLESCDFFRTPVGTLRGRQVLAFSTNGDGVFAGSDGFEYGVDAGLIGLVPIDLADGGNTDLMSVVTFTKTIRCSRTMGGLLVFGPVVIDARVEW